MAPVAPRPAPARRCCIPLVATLVATLLAGCETLVDVGPTDHEPVLVAYSLFAPDRDWYARLTHSVPFGDTSDVFTAAVTDATVEVLYGGAVVAVLTHRGSGEYVAEGVRPESGVPYTLRAVAPGYAPITAESRVPLPVDGLTATPEAAGAARVRFADPVGAGFYELRLLAVGTDTTATLFSTDAPSIRTESFYESVVEGNGRRLYEQALFSDALFDGRTFEAALGFDPQPSRSYEVDLTVVSAAYFRHFNSLRLIEQAEGNPFAEPIAAYSNVTGGLGIFAGYYTQRVPVR